MIDKEHITGIILTGGQSSRMGSDKASMMLNEKSFFQHVAEAVSPVVSTVFMVSDNPEHDKFGVSRIEDLMANAGPLSGVYSGLIHSSTNLNLVLSCDIPFIKTKTLELLLNTSYSHYDIVQLMSKGKTMPLIATYKKHCAPVFLELLNSGERRLRKAIERLKTKTIEVDGKQAYQVQNINTKEQLNSILHAYYH